MKKQTQCVHGGRFVDSLTGGINTPIFTSSVFKYLNHGKQPYPRYFNTPNQDVVVEKLCELEQAEAGIVFSSGMAAISTALLSLVKKGDHIVLNADDGSYVLEGDVAPEMVGKKVKVTGTVAEKDDMKVISVTSVEEVME